MSANNVEFEKNKFQPKRYEKAYYQKTNYFVFILSV